MEACRIHGNIVLVVFPFESPDWFTVYNVTELARTREDSNKRIMDCALIKEKYFVANPGRQLGILVWFLFMSKYYIRSEY
jgi:hypothetical protein